MMYQRIFLFNFLIFQDFVSSKPGCFLPCTPSFSEKDWCVMFYGIADSNTPKWTHFEPPPRRQLMKLKQKCCQAAVHTCLTKCSLCSWPLWALDPKDAVPTSSALITPEQKSQLSFPFARAGAAGLLQWTLPWSRGSEAGVPWSLRRDRQGRQWWTQPVASPSVQPRVRNRNKATVLSHRQGRERTGANNSMGVPAVLYWQASSKETE